MWLHDDEFTRELIKCVNQGQNGMMSIKYMNEISYLLKMRGITERWNLIVLFTSLLSPPVESIEMMFMKKKTFKKLHVWLNCNWFFYLVDTKLRLALHSHQTQLLYKKCDLCTVMINSNYKLNLLVYSWQKCG